MLGLGLVVGLIALLLGGTFLGLFSYMAAMKTQTAKFVELHKVDDLIEKMGKLAELYPPPGVSDVESLRTRSYDARQALEAYRLQLLETLEKGRDPDHG